MLRKASLAALFASTFFLLNGCGGGSSSTGPTGSPFITVSATSLTFANTIIGQTSAPQTVTVTNTGTASATISGVALSGNTTDFSQTATTCNIASLAANASCTITFTFIPQAVGNFTLTITVSDNAANSPQPLILSGTGTAVPPPTASLTGGPLTFTGTASGSVSSAQTLTLTNSGGSTLTITAVNLGSDFVQTTGSNACGNTLTAGSSCLFYIAFSPSTAGATYNESFILTDNAGGVAGSTQTVALSGTSAVAATAPAVNFSTSTVAFPSVTVNTSATPQTVTLYNTGNASLTGIAVSITGGATASAFTINSTTCTATLIAGANCTITVGFSPTITGTFTAFLNVADNATGSPQQVTLTGTSTSVPAPAATFSSTSISFPTTTAGTTTSSYSVTLTNTGNATLNITSIVLGGTNPGSFAQTTTCGSTLAANISCTISATFSPTTASSYSATVTVTDNATGSPTVITLSGSGTTSSVVRTFYVFGPSAPAGVTGYVTAAPLYTFINNAQKTIDMTMYELQDTTFSGDLVTACGKGVKVRVILSSSEKSNNTPAYNQLNTAGANCSAVYSNTAFTNTHQKTITVDGNQTAILSLNLQTQYYSTSRDFALIENDAADIAAIQATFNTDYAAGTPYGGTQGASDFSYVPGNGDTGVVTVPSTGDLIWSPTNAQTEMLRIINGATKTLLVENEEMSASNIVSALEAACKNGVTVNIAMVNSSTSSPFSSYATNFKALEAAGCGVRTYPDTTTGLYIHAKAVVADYGLSTQSVYMGSINYSTASMNQNRELGIYIADPGIVQTLYTVLSSDYAGATTF